MKLKLFFLTSAALLFAACGSDDATEELIKDATNNNKERKLTVVVNEAPIVGEGESADARVTRAEEITTSTLSRFYLNYQDNQQTFEKSGTWSKGTWWNLTEADWYAYNEGTFQYNSGTPYISFTAIEDASTTKDLLYAFTHATFYPGYNKVEGAISLSFKHACAAVTFTITNSKSETVNIHDIILNGAVKTGKYYYGDGWKETSGTTNYTLDSRTDWDLAVSKTGTALSCGTVFLIPQTLGTIVVRYTNSESQKKKTTFTLNKPIEAGKSYPINIILK